MYTMTQTTGMYVWVVYWAELWYSGDRKSGRIGIHLHHPARPGQARQPACPGEYSGYIHTYVYTYLILRVTYVLPCNIWMSSVYTRYTSTWSNPSLALYVALFSIIVYMYYVLCTMYTTCLCIHVCTQYTYNCRTPSSAANVAQHSAA